MTSQDDLIMLILSSPSGVGKTTISKKIQQKFQNFKISVSDTTRKPRENEVNGIDYFFISIEEFKKKIQNSGYYEHAKIFDNFYGTSKNEIEKNLKKNNNILFDIDWQGTKQLSKFTKFRFLKIFILPPNKEELKKRLINRGPDNKKSIEKRLSSFEQDKKYWCEYDYIVINDNLETCFNQIKQIILSNLIFEKPKFL